MLSRKKEREGKNRRRTNDDDCARSLMFNDFFLMFYERTKRRRKGNNLLFDVGVGDLSLLIYIQTGVYNKRERLISIAIATNNSKQHSDDRRMRFAFVNSLLKEKINENLI